MIYVDVFVFINIFEDFLLLLAVKRILRLDVHFIRLMTGSAVGGLLSVLSLFKIPFVLSIPLKAVTALITVLAAFGVKSRIVFIKATAALLIVTFLVSGAMICFYLALKPDGMMIINGAVYFDINPLLLIILTLAVYFILVVFKKLFRNHGKTDLNKKIIIHYKNNKLSVNCKVDSGLNVKEPFSGGSVIIIDKSAISFEVDKAKLRLIPYNSFGGNGIMWGFKADSVIIDSKESFETIYIGMSEKPFGTNITGLVPINLTGE